MLSKRMTESYLGEPNFLSNWLVETGKDNYDPIHNPNGYVNLGTAVNALNEAEIESWLLKDGVFQHERKWQHYHEFSGHTNVKETIAKFLSEKLGTPKPLSSQNINLQAGVSTLLESLAFALGDPGDVFVINFPVYARFGADISERAQIKLMGPTLRASNDFQLSAEAVDDYIKELKKGGHRVKAFFHCNPNNPLGDIYGEETTLNLMRVCKEHQIHFICDEIYALSIFKSEGRQKFKSVLSFDEVPDPERTHFLWGMSKDFGIASFRYGVLHTLNKDLLQIMEGMQLYSCVQGHIQQIGAKMLADQDWLEQDYFPRNLQRLEESYESLYTFFTKFGCKVRKSMAGLFAWVDFSPLFNEEATVETEKQFFLSLLVDYKIYIPNGTEFGSKDPGWFRIIFAIKRDHWTEFCNRFEKFVKIRQSNK